MMLESDSKATPSPLSFNSGALLSTAADPNCKQLTAAGKPGVKQQPVFAPAEFSQLVQVVKELPPSSFRHTAPKHLLLVSHWGGRESEFAKIMRR
jgi:hypothetical protein